MTGSSRLSSFIEASVRNEAVNAPRRQTPIDYSVKIGLHKLKTRNHARLVTIVGDPSTHDERITKFLDYWDQVVLEVLSQVRIMFPDMKESSPADIGSIRNDTKWIAKTGYDNAIEPSELIADAFNIEWIHNSPPEFTQRRFDDSTKSIVMSTMRGLASIEQAIHDHWDKHQDNEQLTSILWGRGNDAQEAAKKIYTDCRENAIELANYAVHQQGGSETLTTSPEIASLTTRYVENAHQYIKTHYPIMLKELQKRFENPVNQADIVNIGIARILVGEYNQRSTKDYIAIITNEVEHNNSSGYTSRDEATFTDSYMETIKGLRGPGTEPLVREELDVQLTSEVGDWLSEGKPNNSQSGLDVSGGTFIDDLYEHDANTDGPSNTPK